ncbi:MAG: methyltransferase [Candidatus Omnitrophica bacterium]|nr:methyltransferase [Candidatus Omnitrophota bacterium]
MCKEIIKAQKDNSMTVNYNKWIFDNIRPYIGDRVIDVGAGMGNFLPYLLNKELIITTDILDAFIDDLRKEYSSYANLHVFKSDIQDDNFTQLVFPYNIDTVICNNVLEHVRDDIKALENINAILNKKGNLILVLPAFQCLYSRWDKAVGHFRRYDRKDIKDKLLKTKFSIKVHFYMNMAGFFGWFLNGRVLRNTPTKDFLVKEQAVFFDRYLVNPLKKLESIFRPCFGQSLVVIAKPES